MKKRPHATKPKRRNARMTAYKRGSSAARLDKTIAVLTRERDELLEQQSATADLLCVIQIRTTASPADRRRYRGAALPRNKW
jgi:hypothetical protein